MKYLRILAASLAVFLFMTVGHAQTADVTVTLNEQFFDALLDSMFEHGGPPAIAIAKANTNANSSGPMSNGFVPSVGQDSARQGPCNETIRLLRETQSVRTAVRFREGKIYAPLAFSGSYNPPLIGCIDFSGYAETNIDLEFDRQMHSLIGRVRVLNVSLDGTAGIGSSVLTRMVQSSIDKRLNPIEILKAEKLSFNVPVQNSSIRMEATAIRSEITNGALLIHIDYSFPK